MVDTIRLYPGTSGRVQRTLTDLQTDAQIKADGARQLARDNLQLVSTASREIIRWTQVVIRDPRFAVPISVYSAIKFVRDALRLFGIL